MADESDDVVEGEEVVDARSGRDRSEVGDELPVTADVGPLQRPTAPTVPAVHAAALAATGFVAGAAAAALVRRRSSRRLGRANARGRVRRSADGLPIISSHTYLVRVQLLGRPAD